MTLEDFRKRVRATFGAQMQHATPANVREFLDTLARDHWREEKQALSVTAQGRYVLPDERATSYEEVLRQFFSDVLDAPRDDALIQVWTLALELAYAGLEEQDARQIGGLFREKEGDRDSD